MAHLHLVEDNEMNRDMLSRRLKRKGYEITIAEDGEQAILLAQTQKPDLILMDMNLPVKDGWETTRHLKEHQATKNISIIALTAHAMSGDREKALQAGCDEYEQKPVDFPKLLAKIEDFLKAESSRRPFDRPLSIDE